MAVKFRAGGWEWGGEPRPWLFAQVNYWELERSHWRDVLKTVAASGQTVISVAVPPAIHFLSTGHYDFGTTRPQLDLGAFLNEVKALGLKAFLWVGPRDLPGVPAAGYPAPLLEMEEALARNSQGHCAPSAPCQSGEVFALPCLVSQALTDALQPFADHLRPVLEPHLDPDGPVIGLGLTQAPGWGNALAPFAADYHPEAITAYQHWLKHRYGKPEALNSLYGTAYGSFAEVQPPRDDHEKSFILDVFHLDWAQAREEYFVRAAERLYRVFAPLAQSRVPLMLAALPTAACPANFAELDKLRAFDACWPELPLTEGDEAILRVASDNRFGADLRAVLPEPGAAADAEFGWLKQVALGVRGWDVVAAAGSGAYPGFLCDRRGRSRRPLQPLWPALQEAAQTEGFLSSQLFTEITLVVWPRLERLRYLATPETPVFDPSPWTVRAPVILMEQELQAWEERWWKFEGFLRRQQFPYGLLSADAGADRWSRAGVLAAASTEGMTAGEQQWLVQKVQTGFSVILVGPLPRESDALTQLAQAKPPKSGRGKTAKSGRLIHFTEFTETKLLRALQQTGVPRPLVFEPAPDRVVFHKYRNRVFVAAINAGDLPLEALARREGKFVLHDLWNQSKYWGGNHEIKVALGPRQVKWWELIEC